MTRSLAQFYSSVSRQRWFPTMRTHTPCEAKTLERTHRSRRNAGLIAGERTQANPRRGALGMLAKHTKVRHEPKRLFYFSKLTPYEYLRKIYNHNVSLYSAASALARRPLKVVVGVMASGSIRSSIRAGLPLACASSKAFGKSSVRVTVVPKPP